MIWTCTIREAALGIQRFTAYGLNYICIWFLNQSYSWSIIYLPLRYSFGTIHLNCSSLVGSFILVSCDSAILNNFFTFCPPFVLLNYKCSYLVLPLIHLNPKYYATQNLHSHKKEKRKKKLSIYKLKIMRLYTPLVNH